MTRGLIFILSFLIISICYPFDDNKNKIEYSKNGNLINVIEYHSNGIISQKGSIFNGKLEGKWVSFDKNGNELVVGFYKNGKKEGKWSFKTKNSVHQVNFKNNKIISNF